MVISQGRPVGGILPSARPVRRASDWLVSKQRKAIKAEIANFRERVDQISSRQPSRVRGKSSAGMRKSK